MNYRGLPIIATPPRSGTFVPVTVHSWSFPDDELVSADRAVVPQGASGGFATVAGGKFLTTVVPPRVLTNQLYKMSDLYPEDYQTMTECPEAYDCSQLTTANGMFAGCAQLTEVPALNLDMCTHAGFMFRNCAALTAVPTLDLTGYTNTNSLFEGCSSLTAVNVLTSSSLNVVQSMFKGCSSLTTVSFIDTSGVYSALDLTGISCFSSVFEGCSSLPSTFPWTINLNGLSATQSNADNLRLEFMRMFTDSSVTEVTFSHASTVIRSMLADGTTLKFGGMTVHFVDNAD